MEKKVCLMARFRMFDEETGKFTYTDATDAIVDKEQFTRIKNSYVSGKFEYMNEDSDISDICELFTKFPEEEYGPGEYFIRYPAEISVNIPFEKLPDIYDIKDEESYIDDDPEWDAACEEEEEYFWDHMEEFEARDKAVDEFQEWMRARGLDIGDRSHSIFDDDGHYIETVDIGWPYGLYGSKGYTKAVALKFFRVKPEKIEALKRTRYEVFESIEELKAFIEKYCI